MAYTWAILINIYSLESILPSLLMVLFRSLWPIEDIPTYFINYRDESIEISNYNCAYVYGTFRSMSHLWSSVVRYIK